MCDADAAFAAAFPDDPLAPAILAEDDRGVLARLSETRDQAARVGDGLATLEAAGDGLARVRHLVGRLRDIAVVALDRGLQPADRAALQRQLDRALTEIDHVARTTLVDDRLLRGGAARAAGDTGKRQLASFRAIGTTALGIAGLAVRSSDQALAASGALDVAAARLERSAGTLSRATARLRDQLRALTSPATTATGQAALGTSTAAPRMATTVNARFPASPQEAAQTQDGLDAARVS